MISSLQNPIVKNIVKLRKSAKERREQNRMIIEGAREISRALSCDWPINQLFVCPDLSSGELVEQAQAKEIEVIELSKKAFEKISYRESGDGFLALSSIPKRTLKDLENHLTEKGRLPLSRGQESSGTNPLLLIAEGIEKPGNIGSLLRVADGAGVDALILCDSTVDIWNPNVVRTSTGTLFSTPLAITSSEKTISWLNSQKIKKVITSPDTNQTYSNIDYGDSCAIIIGSEQAGLTEKWMKTADQKVTIPMHGSADSLNAAISAAIIIYEAVRQRS